MMQIGIMQNKRNVKNITRNILIKICFLSIMIAAVITIIFILIELFILYLGINMFCDNLSIICILVYIN